VNPKTKHGQTPLIRAYQHGHLDIVRLLIEANANVNVKTPDNEAKTPLFMACDYDLLP
jgi:ankyrin repeat protein